MSQGMRGKTKVCTRCGEEKPADEEHFRKAGKGNGRLHSWCRACNREYAREKRQEEDADAEMVPVSVTGRKVSVHSAHWHPARRAGRGRFVRNKRRTECNNALLVHPRESVRLPDGRRGVAMLVL